MNQPIPPVIENLILSIEEDVFEITALIDGLKSDGILLLEKFATAKAPQVDLAHSQLSETTTQLYRLTKSRKLLLKSIKNLRKTFS